MWLPDFLHDDAPVGRGMREITMVQQDDGTLTTEECGTLEGKFAERTRRVNALFELDRVLSDAANRYNLAADIVRFGWPHSTERPRRAD